MVEMMSNDSDKAETPDNNADAGIRGAHLAGIENARTKPRRPTAKALSKFYNTEQIKAYISANLQERRRIAKSNKSFSNMVIRRVDKAVKEQERQNKVISDILPPVLELLVIENSLSEQFEQEKQSVTPIDSDLPMPTPPYIMQEILGLPAASQNIQDVFSGSVLQKPSILSKIRPYNALVKPKAFGPELQDVFPESILQKPSILSKIKPFVGYVGTCENNEELQVETIFDNLVNIQIHFVFTDFGEYENHSLFENDVFLFSDVFSNNSLNAEENSDSILPQINKPRL